MMENELKPCPFCGGAPNLNGPCWVDEIDQYSVTHRCGVDIYSMGVHETAESAIAAWNARAGGEGEPYGYVVKYSNGCHSEFFPKGTEPYLKLHNGLSQGGGTPIPLYTHPSPAIDAGEVERLVDALKKSADALWQTGIVYGAADDDSKQEREAYSEMLKIRKSADAARASLLEYVSKGVDVGDLVALIKEMAFKVGESDMSLSMHYMDRLAAVRKGGA